MFELEVVDVFHLGSGKTVFTGRVAAGRVQIGDSLILRSRLGEMPIAVALLEPRGLARLGAIEGDNIAIVTDHLDLGPVADGIRQLDTNLYEIVALKLQSQEVNAANGAPT
ncbi:hypothetical protein LL974_09450 [Xanthomonas campestris pv. cannae]|nr:hypothetical protein [Xanthomonas campestris pv. cannae]